MMGDRKSRQGSILGGYPEPGSLINVDLGYFSGSQAAAPVLGTSYPVKSRRRPGVSQHLSGHDPDVVSLVVSGIVRCS